MPDADTVPEQATVAERGAAASGARPVAEPGFFASRYRLDRELARGGMGRVLVAHDLRIGREVAIKELLRKHSAPAVARFWRESVMTARLQHPASSRCTRSTAGRTASRSSPCAWCTAARSRN